MGRGTFHGRGLFLREGDPSAPPLCITPSMPQLSTSLITIFPWLEIVVTKNFNSIMPRFQFEGQLLYEGRLLIFHQGCGLVTHMYTILYSSCSAIQYMHARCPVYTETFSTENAIFTDARFTYMKTVQTRMKTHENIFTSKRYPKWKLSKSSTYCVNTTKTGVKTQQKFAFFSQSVFV